MIYLIDDSNFKQMNALYVHDDAYKDILHVVSSVSEFDMLCESQFHDAECIMVHRTFDGTTSDKEKIADLTDDGDKIPYVVFSAGDSSSAVFDEIHPFRIMGLKKEVFYERLRDFLDNYLENHKLNLWILAYGKNYMRVRVRNWALAILRNTSTIKGFIDEQSLGCITKDGNLKKIIDVSAPAIGITYDELVNDKLIDEPIKVDEFKSRINKITNSFYQYGKNIYTWE